MKDLVNEPDKKYKNMYEIINNQNSKDFRENLLPTVDTSNTQMKNELKNYLKSQHTSTSTSISDLIPSSKKKIKITELI